ncbi:hypothetical protein [Streptomyces sp. NPDC093707]|uniref:hypothetical protein n=1 Tax=Streptomyces sp. NPDC093707 TaxID=3154984 RepID=UPI00344DA732
MNEIPIPHASNVPPAEFEFRKAAARAADALKEVLLASPLSVPRLYVSPDIAPAAVVTVRLKRWLARGRAVSYSRPQAACALEHELHAHGIGASVHVWQGSGLWIALGTVADVAALTRYAASQLPADCASAYRLRRAFSAIGVTSTTHATADGRVRPGALSPEGALRLYECLAGRSSGTAAHALDLTDIQDLYTLAGLLEPAVTTATRRRVTVVVRRRARPEIALGAAVPIWAANALAAAVEDPSSP